MSCFDEAKFEIVTMEYLRDIGYGFTFGLDISPDGPACERNDYNMVVLIGRHQNSLENINPNIPLDAEKFVGETGL